MNEKRLQVLVALLVVGLITFIIGKNITEEKYSEMFSGNEITVSDCADGGCFINLPNKSFFFARCKDGYMCSSVAISTEQRKKDESKKQEFQEIFNDTLKE